MQKATERIASRSLPSNLDVSHNADDLPPVVFRTHANLLAERARSIVPILARHSFGDDCDGNLVVDVTPSEVATGDERRAECFEKARCNESEPVERKLTL